MADSLGETLTSHMIQEEFPCPCGEGLCGNMIVHRPVSSPLFSVAIQGLLGSELTEGETNKALY